MPPSVSPPNFTAEQLELWHHVNELWKMSVAKDQQRIRDALHPDYMGWDMSSPLPHDREAAVHSVTDDAPNLTGYELEPLSVRVYEGTVGIVHYRYKATVDPQGVKPVQVTGRWTEIYTRREGRWVMVAVSGLPGSSDGAQSNN